MLTPYFSASSAALIPIFRAAFISSRITRESAQDRRFAPFLDNGLRPLFLGTDVPTDGLRPLFLGTDVPSECAARFETGGRIALARLV